ncbi:MAG: hypothetical protein ACR2FH_08245 [Caulobacteraceae bacterium]
MDKPKSRPAKKTPAGKPGAAKNARLKALKTEREQLTKTINEAKARRGELDAERKVLRGAGDKAI